MYIILRIIGHLDYIAAGTIFSSSMCVKQRSFDLNSVLKSFDICDQRTMIRPRYFFSHFIQRSTNCKVETLSLSIGLLATYIDYIPRYW